VKGAFAPRDPLDDEACVSVDENCHLAV